MDFTDMLIGVPSGQANPITKTQSLGTRPASPIKGKAMCSVAHEYVQYQKTACSQQEATSLPPTCAGSELLFAL